MDDSQYELRPHWENHKVILLGNPGAGKTTLFRIFAGLPTSKSNSTQGLREAQHMKNFDHHRISLWLWDTAGMERMQSLTNSYYRDSNAAILVINATHGDSLNDLNTIWLEAVRAREYPESRTQLFLVVTRQDKVEKAARSGCIPADYVREDDVKRFIHETGNVFSKVYFTRSIQNDEIDKMFDDIALNLKLKTEGNNIVEEDASKIILEETYKKGFQEKFKHFFSKCC